MVCTRNRPDELQGCLESIACLRDRPAQVVVVDNASAGCDTRNVAEHWHTTYVIEPVPGLSRARNRGVRTSTSEIIAFVDDDARPDPNWISELAREFEDPQVMAVAGRALPVTVKTDAQKLYSSLGGYDRGYSSRMVLDRQTPNWFEMANFGGIGIGMNMAFRREAFRLWPGFDERLGRGAAVPGNEEHHAFFSLIDRGWRVIYTPSAIVHHPFPSTWEEFREQQLETLSCGFGYLTFLLRNEPRYRGELLRFAFRRLRCKAANWRHAPAQYRRLIPLWRQVPAMLRCAVRSLAAARRVRPDAIE
ncbi:MAG: glycosyltransferase family 2 protein [Terriglobales bacterium]